MDALDWETKKVYLNFRHSISEWKKNGLVPLKKITLLWKWVRVAGDDPYQTTEHKVTQNSDMVRVRPCNKEYQFWRYVKENLKVGDFVKCSAVSRTYRWRKVIKIENNQIFGQCCSQPNDESLAFHSSENGLHTVLEIVKQ